MSGVSLLGQLRCQHSYFANNRCPALQLQPSDACQAELARRQWRFRPSRDGGAVYALPGAEHSALPGAPLLSFWLLRQDPWLDSYTGLPVTPNGANINLAFPNDANRILKI